MPNKNFIIIALCLATLVTMLVFSFMKTSEVKVKKEEATFPVIVAKVEIPVNTIIKAEMIEIRKIPIQYVPLGVVTSLNAAIEKVLLTNATVGQMIFEKDLKDKDASLGLSYIIPPNMRAISVQVDSAASIARLIKPGDMVDILVTLTAQDQTVTVLQNVLILAIDQQTETKYKKEVVNINTVAIVTFALTLKDAEKLVLASSQGPLQLALRSAQGTQNIQTSGISGTSLSNISPAQVVVRQSSSTQQDTQQNVKMFKGTTSTTERINK